MRLTWAGALMLAALGSDIGYRRTTVATSSTCTALTGSTTNDLASLNDGVGSSSITITVTGAALGDYTQVSAGVDLLGMTVTGYVSAADTVTVRVQNESGSARDLDSTTWRARVTPAGC